MKKKARQTHIDAQSLKYLTCTPPKSQGHDSQRKTEEVSQIRGNTKVIGHLTMMGNPALDAGRNRTLMKKLVKSKQIYSCLVNIMPTLTLHLPVVLCLIYNILTSRENG